MKANNLFRNSTFALKRIYRLFRLKNKHEIVWKDLIKLHKQSGWHFTHHENDKVIVTSIHDNDTTLEIYFMIEGEKLLFFTYLLPEFDIERTNDVMILSSHLNSLMRDGVVCVNLHHNDLRYTHTGDLLRYLLYPEEIYQDLTMHFILAKEGFISFKSMLNTGDDPVFIVADLMKRVERIKQD